MLGDQEMWSSSEKTIYAIHKDKQVSYTGFKTVLSNMTNPWIMRKGRDSEVTKWWELYCFYLLTNRSGKDIYYAWWRGRRDYQAC